MKKLYFITLFLFLAVNAFAQFNVNINVTDAVFTNIENADVTLDVTTLQTDVNGNVTFPNVLDGTYNYTISKDCFEEQSGSITVNDGDVNNSYSINLITTANIFWNVNEDNSPMSFPVATADITMTDGANTYSITYTEFDNIMMDIPFGTYDYTISTDCHEDRTGTVTLDCANIDPNNPTPTVAIWEVQGDAMTMANIFWNVNEDNSPMSFPVATADITMTDGANTYSITYTEFDNIMMDIPFGTYDYTISTDCHEDRTGSVTVDCGNIDPNNPTPTVAVWEVQGDALTTANIFWNVNEDNSPMSFPVATADITMTDGANTYSITYSEFDNIMMDIPFGTYDYTISTDCHEDRTGSVTVDCGNIDPNNPTPTVAVWEVQGDELTIANVFVSTSNDPIIGSWIDGHVNLNDGVNNYDYDVTEFDNIIADVVFGVYDYTFTQAGGCYEPITGTLTVDCASIDPMSGNVFFPIVDEGEAATAASIFVSTSNDPVIGSWIDGHVNLNDGVNNYDYNVTEFDNIIADVVFGVYDYTFTQAGGCFESITGTLTVDCASIDPMSGNVFFPIVDEGEAATAASIFVSTSNDPVIGSWIDGHVNLNDGVNNYDYDVTEFDNIIADVAFGTYDYTFTQAGGCYESITGILTVDCASIDPNSGNVFFPILDEGEELIIDASVTQTGDNILKANEADVSYQWVDCNNGNAPIPGETNQSFIATEDGSYAVILTSSVCTDYSVMSSCYEVTVLGIGDNESPFNLIYFPNPVTDNLNINLNNSYNNVEIQIYTMVGQLIRTINKTNSVQMRINLSELSSGTYILKINADGKNKSMLIIKK